VFGA
jgi:dihydrofolate synthase / folylpolyglutamate synthase